MDSAPADCPSPKNTKNAKLWTPIALRSAFWTHFTLKKVLSYYMEGWELRGTEAISADVASSHLRGQELSGWVQHGRLGGMQTRLKQVDLFPLAWTWWTLPCQYCCACKGFLRSALSDDLGWPVSGPRG